MVLEAREVAPCIQHGSVQAQDQRLFYGECRVKEDAARE